jgi:hypothetical protein
MNVYWGCKDEIHALQSPPGMGGEHTAWFRLESVSVGGVGGSSLSKRCLTFFVPCLFETLAFPPKFVYFGRINDHE